MKGTKQTISICGQDRRGLGYGPVAIEAVVYAQYAVHKTPAGWYGHNRGYVVTHLPSQLAMCIGVTQALARRIAVACAPLDMPYATREDFPREQLDLLFRTMQTARGY